MKASVPSGLFDVILRLTMKGILRVCDCVCCVCAGGRMGRAHIVSAVFNHGISEYGNKDGGVYWEEMLLPDDDDDEQRLLHAAVAAAAAGPKL
jgi:hypothetical protein